MIPERILIVRLGSLGDIIHTLPVVDALRRAFPEARLDWMVDQRQQQILELVPVIDHRVVVSTDVTSWARLIRTMAEVRRTRYDVAIDLQGLLKSAWLARASAARRVIGFTRAHLREPAAASFYTERCAPDGARHVIEKNLSVLRCFELDVPAPPFRFPLTTVTSTVVAMIRDRLRLSAHDPFALINPGGAWLNKRWPPGRFAEVAAWLQRTRGWRSVALWGPGEDALAREVVAGSGGAAELSPPTSLADLVALARAARLMISGDTGPLHMAAALGTPVVGIFGPTSPARNGPWSAADRSLSRFDGCICHHERRCRRARPCVWDISTDEVLKAVEDRLEVRN